MHPNSDESLTLPDLLLSSTAFLMSKVGKEAQRQVCEALQEDNRQLRHYAVLACLDEFGASTQREIGKRLHFDASDIVALVDDLEADGLVERRRNETDRRRYDVTLTAEGRSALRKQSTRVKSRSADFLSALDPVEREELHELLLRVFASFDSRVPNRGN